MSSKKEFMTQLVVDNDLDTEEDIFRLPVGGKQVAIVTRTGIEKIQYNNNIIVRFEWVVVQKDYAVIKAIATKTDSDVVIETYGSAWHGQGGNCRSNYVMEMAEKRGLARVVLKAVGAYKFSVFGEDESDDFKGE
jgi:hypothetical protein|tara:strand:- start:271 stop:675 length:405 start_codon:yes stop_codon:yes gene_type:complete